MKLTDILKESQHLNYQRMNVGEENEEKGMTKEEKREFLKAVSEYKKFGESIYRSGNLAEVYESIKNIVETAHKVTLEETGDWFDKVTVNRHMKSMNESFKVFSNTIKEVNTLQQRLESCYDEMGEVLGKYYEIKEGNEFGAERAKAIAKGEDEFEVDGKKFPVTDVDAEDKENAKDFANESASRTAMEIGGLTGMNKDAIQKFVDDNNLDIEKVFQYVKKGNLKDRMELVSAISGKPNNPVQKKMISMFSEAKIKMNNLDWGKSTAERNANLDKYDSLKTDKEKEEFLRKLKGESIKEGSSMKLTDILNESKYTVLNPKNGNVMGAGMKDQAVKLSKKLGGEKKGYYVIPVSNAKKARRALEKANFKVTDPKFKSTMSDLYWESVTNESINEGKYDAELDKLADIVKGAKSFMDIGKELKKNGIKYSFGTNMIPMYIIDKPAKIAILNNKYADGAERVVGDTAIGLMESIQESLTEGYSTEEKRIVMMAVRKIMKYKNVDLKTAMTYVLGAGQELEMDIEKGKVKK